MSENGPRLRSGVPSWSPCDFIQPHFRWRLLVQVNFGRGLKSMLHVFYIPCVQMNSDLRRRKVTVRKREQRGAFVIIEADLICPCSLVIHWRRRQRISDEHWFIREFRGQFFNSGFWAVCVCTYISSIHCPCVRDHQYSTSTHTGPARPLVPSWFSREKTSLASLHTFRVKTFMGMKEIVLLVRTKENVILRHQI